MYVCENCNRIIPYNDEGMIPDNCEFCGEPFDLEPARKCVVCGDWKHPNNMQSFGCCKECVEMYACPEVLKKYLESEGDKAEADFYAYYLHCYDGKHPSSSLVDVLKKDFWNWPEVIRKSRALDFLTFVDADNFALWLEENRKGLIENG